LSRIAGTFTSVNIKPSSESSNLESLKTSPTFKSTMPYVLHKKWDSLPIITLAEQDQHYQNLLTMPRSSFVIHPFTPEHIALGDVPLPHLNLTGNFTLPQSWGT